MAENPFTARDRAQLRRMGISESRALSDLESIRKGRVYSDAERPADIGDGVMSLAGSDRESFASRFGPVAAAGLALQFVPASGAATRMFRSLLAVLHRPDAPPLSALVRDSLAGDPDAREFLAWFQSLDALPFRDPLRQSLSGRGLDPEALAEAGAYRPILETLLLEPGLGYAALPKALIPFHDYPDGPRTAFEEHLAEAAELVRDREGICRIHFTHPPGGREAFERAAAEGRRKSGNAGTRFRIGFSGQDPATDTLAADGNGRPFRDGDGSLLFRPAGHGALLGNLEACGGDLVFVRNIDNVLPEPLRPPATAFRQCMGGLLATLQTRLFGRLEALRQSADPGAIGAAGRFAEASLGIAPPADKRDYAGQGREAARDYLLAILDRPLRVCAMIPDRGEPGGGPFWVRHGDGSLRLQILEPQQIDPARTRLRGTASGPGWFSPTDLVCGLKDASGNPFRLGRFADPKAVLVTSKTLEGRPLQALERPGLWNGSMADWNTVFVEAPEGIFNPVKTVTDLLRPGHLAPMPPSTAR